ncbi:hypothetical protein T484DRAFT_1973742 [Baffinella frigidus]|nr:hypothetical protein T484DRAFT_1973742 [Cryptophyta sp. CCMP2293]
MPRSLWWSWEGGLFLMSEVRAGGRMGEKRLFTGACGCVASGGPKAESRVGGSSQLKLE